MNIENALLRIVPEAKFFGRLFTREDYEVGIQWADARTKPTWGEIVAADAANEADAAAQAAADAEDAADRAATRSYPKLAALRSMSPAEVSAWVDANINTLADAKDAIKTLAIVVAYLARKI